jgi:IclR family transcriptional regulator, acetate operon repressor
VPYSCNPREWVRNALLAMTDDPNLNQSVQKAVALLRAAGGHPRGQSISAIARAAGLPRATALRLIRTLQSEGLLLRFPTSDRVGLGFELQRLANLVDPRDAFVEAARRPLEILATVSHETVTLTIVEHDGGLGTIVQIDPDSVLRLADTKGRRGDPLHATSNGKLLLSTMPPEQVLSVVQGPLEQLTPRTITSPHLLEQAINDVRRAGYAMTVDEFEVGITSLSAGIPICGELAGIVAVTGPTSRLDGEAKDRVALHLVEAAHSIQLSLTADR